MEERKIKCMRNEKLSSAMIRGAVMMLTMGWGVIKKPEHLSVTLYSDSETS